jgi:pimeloyl-ACP methyl ester carboxylesterase
MAGCARGPPAAAPLPSAQASEQDAARAFLTDLSQGHWSSAARRFDAQMTREMPADRLPSFWQQILDAEGSWIGVDKFTTERGDSVTVVVADVRFSRRRQRLRVAVSRDGQIAGLFREPVPEDAERIALDLVKALASGDASAAVVDFDAQMRTALPPDKALEGWKSLQAKLGDYRGVDGVFTHRERGRLIAQVKCRMDRGTMVTRIVFNPDGDVAGLFFSSSDDRAAWKPPDYADVEALDERDVTVGSAPALPGVLTLPKGAKAVPAVVLIHGSGPSDRDGSIGGTKIFRDLALGLATRQIASLRYDKRTLVEPRGVVTEKEEVLDGALAAIRQLRATTGVDRTRIVVIGHSQGGALAPRIAQLDGALAGIVILAGPVRSLAVATLAQMEYLTSLNPSDPALEVLLKQSREFKAQVEAPDLRSDTRVDVPGGGWAPGAYFLAARNYHPDQVAASLACPVQVLQGGRDYQVTERDDFERWRLALAGDARATLKVYPELDHRLVAGEGPSTPAQYRIPAHVDVRVIDDMASWIASLPPASAR